MWLKETPNPFVGGLTKDVARGLGRVLRLCRFRVRRPYGAPNGPGAYRKRGNVGGWEWGITLDHEWLASLVRACVKADPKKPCSLLQDILEELVTNGPEGIDDAIEVAWALAGGEGVDKLAKANGYTGPSIGFTYSFDPPDVAFEPTVATFQHAVLYADDGKDSPLVALLP